MEGTTGLAHFALTAALAVACSNGDDETPGASSTTTSGSSSGAQGGGSSSSTAASSGTAGGDPFAWLGLPCEKDVDCGPGQCLRAEDDDVVLHGGPANGYCSKPCFDEKECGVDNVCVTNIRQEGRCMLGCTAGEPPSAAIDTPLDPAKCHGREDVGCFDQPGVGGAHTCIPRCGSDAQCPSGRRCDPLWKVCVEPANLTPGTAFGELCHKGANDCAGTCFPTDGDEGYCSTTCVFGGEWNDTHDCGGSDVGMCLVAGGSAKPGPGDVALCAEACSAHDDCLAPHTWCISTDFTEQGFCGPSVVSPPCPNGQADCPSVDKTCTETIHGPRCLNLAFPLGSLAPGDGGAGGIGGSGGAAGAGGAGGN